MAEVYETLERMQGPHPDRATAKELKSAAVAASRLRREFLGDAWQAVGNLDPRSPEFVAFKECLRSMGELLMKHGFVHKDEMQLLWRAVEGVERR
jgi:hypothetical protein